jgi:hypothetical protein
MLLFAALPDEAAVRPKAVAPNATTRTTFHCPTFIADLPFLSFVDRILQQVRARWILSERKGIKKPSRRTRRSSWPTKTESVLDLKIAKALDWTIPLFFPCRRPGNRIRLPAGIS